MRIQTVEVKTDNPIILSRNRFLDVCSCIFFILLSTFARGNYNIAICKIVINHRVPHTDLTIHIFKVDLGIVTHRDGKFKQLHLIFQSVNQFNVLDVVFHKLLPIRGIEVLEVFVFRVINFFFDQVRRKRYGQVGKTLDLSK